MKKFTEQMNKRASELRLHSSERKELRERILAYMEYHPLPQSSGLPHKTLHKKQIHSFFAVRVWGRTVSLASIFLLLVVPVMAERSLPGDMLYPVKVQFNEELRGAFVSSPYQKIEWETERLERRLAEAKLLADSGKLTAAAEADMARAILEHSAAAKVSIDSIRTSDKDEATIAEIGLASALDVSAEVLGKRDSSRGDASALATAVNEARASVSVPNSDLSYEKLMSRIEAETTRAYEYLNGLGGTISDQDKRDIERRLRDINSKVEGANQIKDTDLVTATIVLTEALSSTKKVISFMTNLEVRNSLTIEELVPATPTDEERRLRLETRLAELDKKAEAVTVGVGKLATTSRNYVDLSEGLVDYNDLRTQVSEYLSNDDLSSAEESFKSASKIIDSLIGGLRAIGVVVDITGKVFP